jgi:hypothetical protein
MKRFLKALLSCALCLITVAGLIGCNNTKKPASGKGIKKV